MHFIVEHTQMYRNVKMKHEWFLAIFFFLFFPKLKQLPESGTNSYFVLFDRSLRVLTRTSVSD